MEPATHEEHRDSNAQDNATPTRDEIAIEYLESLEFEPYPFQEEAILSWFSSEQGVLVCAPTGMGKTVVAEAALYEALRTGKRAYYTTPLIALTEQKFVEMQNAAERWGFDRSDVGLVTGNRRENVDAKILVVVAEILFNRLLSSDAFEAFAKKNESSPRPEFMATTSDGSNSSPATRLSAAELTAKKSLAVSWEDLEKNKRPSLFEEPKTPQIPAVPVVPEDFEEEDDLYPTESHFSFDDVAAVVMDEFHQFSDPERGVVWEFALGLLPPHVRTLLISATVGNAVEFVNWLRKTSNRNLSLIQSNERKVPLVYVWVGDKLLTEQLESMCAGTEEERYTPALVFCFNRDECWDVAEVLKGRGVIDEARRKLVAEELSQYDLKGGAGPKLREMLMRGVGVHHAGVLPKYRRIVESLFQKKLLSFCVCTETLAAGINLPARSVVLPTLLKGPAGDKKLVEPSAAHQIFGRAGRPQYDTTGYVFAMAPEDDVRIARALKKYNEIPDDVKDLKMREMKKKLKKKLPKRNPNAQYWSETQFDQLRVAPPGRLASRGPTPWRMLAHLIECNSDVRPIRALVTNRLVGPKKRETMLRSLDRSLLTLWRGGFVRLAPNPVNYGIPATAEAQRALADRRRDLKEKERRRRPFGAGIFDDSVLNDPFSNDAFDPVEYNAALKKLDVAPPEFPEIEGLPKGFDFFSNDGDLFTIKPDSAHDVSEPNQETASSGDSTPVLTFGGAASTNDSPSVSAKASEKNQGEKPEFDLSAFSDEIRDQIASSYQAARAYPTPKLKTISALRGVNQVYGAFLLEQLGLADRGERLQAFESLLEIPNTVARYLRVPRQDVLPRGRLATERLDQELLSLGLATIEELVMPSEEEETRKREDRRRFGGYMEERVYTLPFADKLRRLFDFQYPGVNLRALPVWAAGDLLLDYKGDFNKYVLSKNLQKQEGVVFRHLLRLILLVEEFIPLSPVDGDPREWRADLTDIYDQLVECCRKVDPLCVEETLRASKKNDLLQKS